MTLAQIVKNAQNYSFSGLYSDVSWLAHNCRIKFPVAKHIIDAADDFERFIGEEIISAKECEECFEISFNSEKGISIPCSKKHVLVWAKAGDFCFYPAKLMRRFDDGSVSVRFFGDYTGEKINAGSFFNYSPTNCPDNGSTDDQYAIALEVCSLYVALCNSSMNVFFDNIF